MGNYGQLLFYYEELKRSIQTVSKVPESKQMLLFTYVRLAHGFSDYKTRLKSVQVVITV